MLTRPSFAVAYIFARDGPAVPVIVIWFSSVTEKGTACGDIGRCRRVPGSNTAMDPLPG